MPTRNVVLSDHQHELVDTLVRSGRYQNASEVLREGLRLVEQRDRLEESKLAALRAAAEVGWRDVEAHRYTDVDDDGLETYISSLGERGSRSADA